MNQRKVSLSSSSSEEDTQELLNSKKDGLSLSKSSSEAEIQGNFLSESRHGTVDRQVPAGDNLLEQYMMRQAPQ